MNQREVATSDVESDRGEWGLLESWKLWMSVSLLVIVAFTVCYELVVNKRRAELGKQLGSTALRLEWALDDSISVRLCDAVLRSQGWNDDWLKTPYAVRAHKTKLNRKKFDGLAQLNLTEFRGEVMLFETDDALAFIRRSPRLELFALEHSAELPLAIVKQLQRERPDLRIVQRGTPVIGVSAKSIWPGLEVEYVDDEYFPGLTRGEILLKLNGKPLETWQQVLRVLKSQESNEPMVFTVRGVDGMEREQIYQQPTPNFHANTRLISREGG